MKIREVMVPIGLAFLISCGSPAPDPEPEIEVDAVVEPTPDEKMAEIVAVCEAAMPAIEQRQAENSLYNRLGGHGGIQRIITTMVEIHLENPDIRPLFDGVDIDNFIKNSTDFVSAGTGGDEQYAGRDIPTVHERMELTPGLFLEAGADLEAAMRQLGIGDAEIQEMMCALVSLRGLVLPPDGNA